jgi:predicted nucleic acid-binding protein
MFLDTSIIVEIFRDKKGEEPFERIFKLIKDEPLFVSVLQIGEISDWCLNNKANPSGRISKLKDIIGIIPLNEKLCIEGAEIKHDMRKQGLSKFSLMDGIILASARSINQKLLTTDSDFRKADDAIVL